MPQLVRVPDAVDRDDDVAGDLEGDHAAAPVEPCDSDLERELRLHRQRIEQGLSVSAEHWQIKCSFSHLRDETGLALFEYPAGVVAALGERARAAIAPGYARSTDGDTHVVEAVVAGAAARDVFLDVIERLPAVDNVEIDVAAHADPVGDRQVWLTPRLKDARRALRFLDDFEEDCLTSGHVDVAVYVRAPRSTWRLTQHKTLLWLSEDAGLTDQLIDKATGALVWEKELPLGPAGAPMTYMAGGRQYVVVALGSGIRTELVAYALPRQ